MADDSVTGSLVRRLTLGAAAWVGVLGLTVASVSVWQYWRTSLRGIDARLHYGIASRAANPLSAHVWVSVGSRAVIGGDEAPNFAEVAAFP